MTITTNRVRHNYTNNLAEVKVHEGESIEAALRRFKKEVLKAGIILEVKKRKHHEGKRPRQKRKKAECKRKAIFNANVKAGLIVLPPRPERERKFGPKKSGKDSNS